jgi:hypothetical protein
MLFNIDDEIKNNYFFQNNSQRIGQKRRKQACPRLKYTHEWHNFIGKF